MKKTIIILLFLLTATAITYAQTEHKTYTQKSPNKITVTLAIGYELLEQIQQGNAYLVDVRTPEEFGTGHLQYAQNINIRGVDFGVQINKLDKNKPMYLYCHSGNRAGKATDSLLVLGFNKPFNIGGLDSLKKAGFPIQ